MSPSGLGRAAAVPKDQPGLARGLGAAACSRANSGEAVSRFPHVGQERSHGAHLTELTPGLKGASTKHYARCARRVRSRADSPADRRPFANLKSLFHSGGARQQAASQSCSVWSAPFENLLPTFRRPEISHRVVGFQQLWAGVAGDWTRSHRNQGACSQGKANPLTDWEGNTAANQPAGSCTDLVAPPRPFAGGPALGAALPHKLTVRGGPRSRASLRRREGSVCSGPTRLLVGPGLEPTRSRPPLTFSPRVCVSEAQSPFLYGRQSHWRGPDLLQYGLILIRNICNNLFPNKTAFPGTGG